VAVWRRQTDVQSEGKEATRVGDMPQANPIRQGIVNAGLGGRGRAPAELGGDLGACSSPSPGDR
jgi:hypothetical protein